MRALLLPGLLAVASGLVARDGSYDALGAEYEADTEYGLTSQSKTRYFKAGEFPPKWAQNPAGHWLLDNYIDRFCPKFVAYRWPQVAFWVDELMGRMELDDSTNYSADSNLTKFAWKAAYATCTHYYDPRGKNPEVRAMYARLLKSDPYGDGRDIGAVPKAPLILKRTMKPCVAWFKNIACDLGWWSKHLNGEKSFYEHRKGICWQNVPYRSPHVPPFLQHPEFQACLSRPFNQTLIKSVCPRAGHTGPKSGTGVPEEFRHELEKCYAKLPFRDEEMNIFKTDLNIFVGPRRVGLDVPEHLDHRQKQRMAKAKAKAANKMKMRLRQRQNYTL